MKKITILTFIVLGLLSIPFTAMQFTEEVNWMFGDFLIMGVALFAIGGSYLLIASKSDKTAYKAASAVGLIGALLLFWVNAAVGIIGNENQDANFLFGVVFIVGAIGIIISNFKSKGLYFAMIAVSVTQALVPVGAYFIWPPPETSWSPGVPQVFMMNSFFVLLFGFSALLYRRTSVENR